MTENGKERWLGGWMRERRRLMVKVDRSGFGGRKLIIGLSQRPNPAVGQQVRVGFGGAKDRKGPNSGSSNITRLRPGAPLFPCSLRIFTRMEPSASAPAPSSRRQPRYDDDGLVRVRERCGVEAVNGAITYYERMNE